MPTKTSVPVNFSDMSNTNITKIRSGAKWKGFGMTKTYDCLGQNGYFGNNDFNCLPGATGGNKNKIFPKKYNIVGMYKPFVNYQSGKGPNNGSIGFKDERRDNLTSIKEINSGENLAYPGTGEPYGEDPSVNTRKDPHAFRARPMKHYRLQYGNDNNKQTYNNRYLLNTINKPGGVILKSYSGLSSKTVTLSNGETVEIDGNWIENQAGYNIIKYGKDRGLYNTDTDQNSGGDKQNWEKLIEAGLIASDNNNISIGSEDIIKYGLWNSSLFDDNSNSLMKGLGSAIRAYPDYTLGKLNKVGKYNPIYFSTSKADGSKNPELINGNYKPNADWACKNCPNYQCIDNVDENGDPTGGKTCSKVQSCVNICDPPTKAKKRVRTSSRINNPALCQRDYYTNNSSYLRSRCKTFSQNEYHYDSQIDRAVGLPEPNAPCGKGWKINTKEDGKNIVNGRLAPSTLKPGCCGRSAACSKAYRSSCPSRKLKKDCKGNITSCQTAVYYKPNNCQFGQQGGVSSSSRLLRLKLNTINSNATSIGKSYGKSAGSALAYSGRPQAPFITKQKMNAGGYIKNKDYSWVMPSLDHNDNIIGYVPSTEGATLLLDNGVVLTARKVLNKMPCDNNLYFLYRPGGGNHVTSVMNGSRFPGGPKTQRIIAKFNPTSEYPNFNNDPGSDNKKFWFIERQNKTVDKNYTKTTKVGF